jgi:hypothetical protein
MRPQARKNLRRQDPKPNQGRGLALKRSRIQRGDNCFRRPLEHRA